MPAPALGDGGIRLFLLIENRLLREALGRLLRKRAEFQVVAVCGVNDVPFPILTASSCDVLAIDFFDPKYLPPQNASAPDGTGVKTVLIGMDEDPDQFLEAVRAGVNAYLLKDASTAEVLSAIRSTYRGESICPPKLCATLFRWIAHAGLQFAPRQFGRGSRLTARQRQLVELMGRGLTNKEIAAQLNLSEFTVRNHVHRILKKADVSSRCEAVDAIRSYAHLSQ